MGSKFMLDRSDTKHWGPRPDALGYIASVISDGAKVLEVGPGQVPFSKATHFVDYKPGANIIMCDVQKSPLPFPDKYFDFVYCRHVVEDIVYPFNFLAEMSRVGKAGYVETPSVVAELCRGIDGNTPPWRGYNHHHWFVWNHKGKLKLLKKYTYVEYMEFNDDNIVKILRSSPDHWNTHLLWDGALDYEQVVTGVVCPEYPATITQAAVDGIESTNQFLSKYKN
jgi:hypothetical protein